MIRPSQILIAVIGIAILAGLQMTNPNYNRAIKPFVTQVPQGELGTTRSFSARFDAWRTTDQIEYLRYDKPQRRTTDGVFLIADLVLRGTSKSAALDAYWLGASGRRYVATKRIDTVPLLLRTAFTQPELDTKTFAIFELPPDEIAGGKLVLNVMMDMPLDGTLALDPPTYEPEHKSVERFDG